MDPEKELHYQVLIEKLRDIPSLPSLVNKLLQVVNHPRASAGDASRYIEQDIGLASKVLKLANSSYYGIPRTITSVNSAVVILGFNTVKTMVLSTSVMKLFPLGDPNHILDRKLFWKHSVVTAVLSRWLAQELPRLHVDPEVAFSAGLLHDMGIIVLDEYDSQEYSEVLKKVTKDRCILYETEQEILDIDHSHISGLLLDHWGVPEALRLPVIFHHSPTQANEQKEASFLVHLTDYLAHRLGSPCLENSVEPELSENCFEILGIKGELKDLLERARNELEQQGDFFNLVSEDKRSHR